MKVSVTAAESASLGSDPQHPSVCKEKFFKRTMRERMIYIWEAF